MAAPVQSTLRPKYNQRLVATVLPARPSSVAITANAHGVARNRPGTRNGGATPEIDRRQHEVDHNAEVRKLKGEPYVRAACQELEPTTSTLYEVQERLIDVDHRASNRLPADPLLLDRLDNARNAMQPQLFYSRRIAFPKETRRSFDSATTIPLKEGGLRESGSVDCMFGATKHPRHRQTGEAGSL